MLPKPKDVFNILFLIQAGISMMNFKIKYVVLRGVVGGCGDL